MKPTMLITPRAAPQIAALAMLAFALPAAAADPLIQYAPPRRVGTLTHEAIGESSGLVAGRRDSHVLWTHNDSGGDPTLYAISPNGENLGSFTLTGVRARDWESIASFRMDGSAYLLIADTGDNLADQPHSALYLVEEPRIEGGAAPANQPLRVMQTIHFRYEDGPRNCEAVAVDPASHAVILVDKVLLGPCGVYRLPIPNRAGGIHQAQRIGNLMINAATAMDISPDGRRAVIGTYGPAYQFTREPGESWADAFQQEPRQLPMPSRAQGESICYGPDGRSLYLTSEGKSPPLWHVPALDHGEE